MREAMPRAIFLVPGYAAQGGTGFGASACFNPDGLGAVVNSSRGITYASYDADLGAEDLTTIVTNKTVKMIEEIRSMAAPASDTANA